MCVCVLMMRFLKESVILAPLCFNTGTAVKLPEVIRAAVALEDRGTEPPAKITGQADRQQLGEKAVLQPFLEGLFP